jgi:hypothetical protein
MAGVRRPFDASAVNDRRDSRYLRSALRLGTGHRSDEAGHARTRIPANVGTLRCGPRVGATPRVGGTCWVARCNGLSLIAAEPWHRGDDELCLIKRRLEGCFLIGDHIEMGLLQDHLDIVSARGAVEHIASPDRRWDARDHGRRQSNDQRMDHRAPEPAAHCPRARLGECTPAWARGPGGVGLRAP